MSLTTGSLSDPPRLIAPESRRLLREARRAKRMGFDKTAEQLASASFSKKMSEPTIGSADDNIKMARLKTGLEQTELQRKQKEQEQQQVGQNYFANEIKDRFKKDGGLATYDWAKNEASKYGVGNSALASFFDRNKMNPWSSTSQKLGGLF